MKYHPFIGLSCLSTHREDKTQEDLSKDYDSTSSSNEECASDATSETSNKSH